MKLSTIVQALLTFFFLYVIYQLIHKIIGGSWNVEEVILAFLVANIGWTFSLQKQFSEQHKELTVKISEVLVKVSEFNSRLSEQVTEHKLIEHRLAALEA